MKNICATIILLLVGCASPCCNCKKEIHEIKKTEFQSFYENKLVPYYPDPGHVELIYPVMTYDKND